jgi:hypothetical protein
MTTKRLSNQQGLKIPHEKLVELRLKGVVQLGILNEVAAAISGNRGLQPTKTTAAAAFKFWNFVALVVFVGSIYLSFTQRWWWFLLGFFVSGLIANSNKKGNTENLLDAAMVDRNFYEKVMALNGWIYEVDLSDPAALEGVWPPSVDDDGEIVASFGEVLERTDWGMAFYDESELKHPKKVIQAALCRKIEEVEDEKLREHLEVGLLATCHFISNLGQSIKAPVAPSLESVNPAELDEEQMKKFAQEWLEQRERSRSSDARYKDLVKQAEEEFALLKSTLRKRDA